MNIEKVFEALYTHDTAKIEVALRRGWDPKLPGPDGQSALHEAALIGAAAIVGLIVRAGVSANAVAEDGDTPLVLAVTSAAVAAKEKVEILSVFDLEMHERIAWSAARGNPEATVRTLIELGANVNAPGADGMNPLLLAIQEGSEPLVRQLLDAGADPTARSPQLTAIELARRGRYRHPEIVTMVKGALPQQMGLDGLDPVAATSPKRPRR